MVLEALARVGVVLVIVVLVTLGLPTIFVGAGYVLSLFLPLGIFHCAWLSLGSACFVLLVYITIIIATYWTRVTFGDQDEWEDLEDSIPYLGDEELDELL